ncbi:MAG: efflux RND transporter periplasmic adaptor subunit [Holophagaceae bacterium]|nr:efflux RND transporter periplasmic adaptor subunit [Holophagaceae bacterium]
MAKTKIKISLGIAGLLAIIAVVIALMANRDDSSLLSWDVVGRGDIRETITASGEFQAKIKVNIGTSIMGEIVELHVRDGQNVKVGDLLVEIDSVRVQMEQTRAKSALDAARNDAERANLTRDSLQEVFERMENLSKLGLISGEDFRQAKLNRDTAQLATKNAEAYVEQVYANLKAVEDDLSKTKLVAPMSGRVTGLKAEKGETAIPGQSNLPGATLMVISDMSEMIAEVMVNENEVVRIKVGQSAQVTAESLPGKVFIGTIVEVATASERIGQEANNMYKVKVALDMDIPGVGELRPGMSARAMILSVEAKNVLMVPLQSLLEKDGTMEEAQKKGLFAPETRTYVMKVIDGKAVESDISTGIANVKHFEVLGGLNEGDVVITGPARKLKSLGNNEAIKLKEKPDTQKESDVSDDNLEKEI